MRLWHQALIKHLPRQQLLGQHRECCALRGKGWNRKHSVVNYVFEHSYDDLYQYHKLIMAEIINRGYKVNIKWLDSNFRGNSLGYDYSNFTNIPYIIKPTNYIVYPEHNDEYLAECLDNLNNKGIYIKIS